MNHPETVLTMECITNIESCVNVRCMNFNPAIFPCEKKPTPQDRECTTNTQHRELHSSITSLTFNLTPCTCSHMQMLTPPTLLPNHEAVLQMVFPAQKMCTVQTTTLVRVTERLKRGSDY